MSDKPLPPEGLPKVVFHYLKSRFFRVIHVDGVLGSSLPRGGIHMTIYSERPALPQKSEHQVGPDGELADPKFTGKEGFVREMEADLMLSRDQAQSMKDWLEKQIADLDALTDASNVQ